jgi:hypothetical protein
METEKLSGLQSPMAATSADLSSMSNGTLNLAAADSRSKLADGFL